MQRLDPFGTQQIKGNLCLTRKVTEYEVISILRSGYDRGNGRAGWGSYPEHLQMCPVFQGKKSSITLPQSINVASRSLEALPRILFCGKVDSADFQMRIKVPAA